MLKNVRKLQPWSMRMACGSSCQVESWEDEMLWLHVHARDHMCWQGRTNDLSVSDHVGLSLWMERLMTKTMMTLKTNWVFSDIFVQPANVGSKGFVGEHCGESTEVSRRSWARLIATEPAWSACSGGGDSRRGRRGLGPCKAAVLICGQSTNKRAVGERLLRFSYIIKNLFYCLTFPPTQARSETVISFIPQTSPLHICQPTFA